MKNVPRLASFAASLLLVVGLGMADAQPTATYDSAVFHTSIAAAMAAANGQPNGSEQTNTASCSGDPGCNDYFDITLGVGNTLFASLCSPGTSTFDTGLAVWRLANRCACQQR